ncbi:MAG: hypothetical protein H5T86_00150 [Armatimonadetes bacterium]|nr:hypothetical protein [Armatimonadota bacterium]
MNEDFDALECECCGATIFPIEPQDRCATFEAVLHRAGAAVTQRAFGTVLGRYCPECAWLMRPYVRRATAPVVATCERCGRHIRSGDWCVTVFKKLGFVVEGKERLETLEVSSDDVAVYCAVCGGRLAMREKTQEEKTEEEYDQDFETWEYYERELGLGMAWGAAEEWAEEKRKRLGLPPDAQIPQPPDFVEIMMSDLSLMAKDFDFTRYEVVEEGGTLRVVERDRNGESDES